MKSTFGSLLLILLLLGIVISPVMAQYSPISQEGIVDPSNRHKSYGEQQGYEPEEKIDWGTTFEKMGSAAMAKSPLEIQKGSNVEKAKYAFRIYCDFLRTVKAPVNDRVETRIASGLSADWTCGDHLEKLQHLFQGAGIKTTYNVECEKDSIKTDRNHVTIGVPDDDKHPSEIYTFDPWLLATRNEGKYDLENDPKWNGMPYSEWEREARKNGYIRFDVNDYDDGFFPTLDEAIKNGAVPGMIIPEAATPVTATSTVPVSEPVTGTGSDANMGTGSETAPLCNCSNIDWSNPDWYCSMVCGL
jgi:hypothetical protein